MPDPPALSLVIGGYSGHVCLKVHAHMEQIAKEIMPAIGQATEVDRVVADTTFPDGLKDTRPRGRMKLSNLSNIPSFKATTAPWR